MRIHCTSGTDLWESTLKHQFLVVCAFLRATGKAYWVPGGRFTALKERKSQREGQEEEKTNSSSFPVRLWFCQISNNAAATRAKTPWNYNDLPKTKELGDCGACPWNSVLSFLPLPPRVTESFPHDNVGANDTVYTLVYTPCVPGHSSHVWTAMNS